MTTKHTPGPLHVNAIFDGRIVGDATTRPEPGQQMSYMLAGCNNTVAKAYRPADAAELARRWNLHEAMLEALRVLADHADETYPHFESERGQREIDAARAIIARAEGA